ncbi:MAG: SDR family NAD(P)-dependent oxidoreductase [Clostridia bacterium]|nr:SDR family NAD(P)-dependent oxidoreductase [Clostridia bacterium]
MRTVLVTGAAGGMGYAVCRRLAADGYAVFGLDLRLPERVPGCEFIRVDLCDPGSVDEVFGVLSERGTALDCIYHAAGIYELDSLLELGEDEWRRVIDVNLTAVCRVNRVFFPLLSPGGRIVITTSELAPLYPLPFTGVYAAVKAALDRYADALRMETQLLGHPVVVVRPGAVDTGMLPVSKQKLERFCKDTSLYSVSAEKFRRIVERVEARAVPPERIADLAAKIVAARRPKAVYSINRNPGLLFLNALPKPLARALVRRLLR